MLLPKAEVFLGFTPGWRSFAIAFLNMSKVGASSFFIAMSARLYWLYELSAHRASESRILVTANYPIKEMVDGLGHVYRDQAICFGHKRNNTTFRKLGHHPQSRPSPWWSAMVAKRPVSRRRRLHPFQPRQTEIALRVTEANVLDHALG
jgi:hypothetical protein